MGALFGLFPLRDEDCVGVSGWLGPERFTTVAGFTQEVIGWSRVHRGRCRLGVVCAPSWLLSSRGSV